MISLKGKYEPLFTEDTRFFVLTGGRGSAKSFSVNTFATILSYEENHKILFTRQTMVSAHLSIIPEFQEKIDLINRAGDFDITKNFIKNKISGSEIIFKGLKTSSGDNTAALKSLQGVTTWILDEAEELVDESMFDKINLSIRKKDTQNRVILILNPTTKEHWIYKKFFEIAGVNDGFNGVKNNVTYIHTSYLDNLDNLDESFINEVNRIKEVNPGKFNHVIMGGWLEKAEGVILTNWEIGEFKEVSKAVFGQDFGFSIDPTTLIKVSIDRSTKTIYVEECFYKDRLTTSDVFQLNTEYAGSSLIYADSAEPRLISELRQKGLNIKEAIKGAGSIVAGLVFLQDHKIIVNSSSVNLIKELNNYVWSDKKSNTPIDRHNHLIDALRYAVYSSEKIQKPVKFKRSVLI